MPKLLPLPLTPDARARTHAVSAIDALGLPTAERDVAIADTATAWRKGFDPHFDSGKVAGAKQVRSEIATIATHGSFCYARDLALALYFETSDFGFVIGVLDGIGQPVSEIDQDTAPALWMRDNGFSAEQTGRAIGGHDAR